MSDTTNDTLKSVSQGKSASGIDWNDPSIPAGDSPPMPQWPLVAVTVVWCAWIAFLVAMTIMRLQTSAV